MKKWIIIILSGLFVSPGFSQIDSDSSKAIAILKKIENTNKKQKELYYKSSQTYINSGVDDSISHSTGEVWIKIDRSDSIFGSKFHVKGKDKIDSFDYYYDGKNGYELRHSLKNITVFDPFKFPNDANNPAKARMALSPMVPLLTDIKLLSTLLKNNPQLKLSSSGDHWIIKFNYPANEYGITNLSINILKSSFKITQVKRLNSWNGIRFISDYNIEYPDKSPGNLTENIQSTQIFSYKDYSVENYSRPSGGKEEKGIINEEAPNFGYPALDGKLISLNDYKGKFVLLDFWETWCGYCILAIPKIEDLYQKYNLKGLMVMGITTENKKGISTVVSKNNLSYPTLFADKTVLDKYKITGRPTYVLIDPSGIVIQYAFGNLEEIISTLDSKLK